MPGISAYCVKCRKKVQLNKYTKKTYKVRGRTVYMVCGLHNNKDKVCRIVSKVQYQKL